MKLWEILVPTIRNGKPVRTKHHKEWDKWVQRISGGLTIFKPTKGKWISNNSGVNHEERMIPVRIACEEKDIHKIIEFTIRHYEQEAVMAYLLSEQVVIKYAFDRTPTFKQMMESQNESKK